jgi:hypothetical protein
MVTPIEPDCPEAFRERTVGLQGMVAFGADFTYERDVVLTVTETSSIPKACRGGTCPPPEVGVLVEEGAVCKYTTVSPPLDIPETGVYSSSGCTLELEPAGGTEDEPALFYGFKGDSLVIVGSRTFIEEKGALTAFQLSRVSP